MLNFCFQSHHHLVLSFMFHFLFPSIFCCNVYKCTLCFLFSLVFLPQVSSVFLCLSTFESIFCLFYVCGCCIFIFLMLSLHQELLNGVADLDEKKTCNIMHFILFSTLEDFCVNPITVLFHLACNSQVSINCLDTFLIPAPYKINPAYILYINPVYIYILL